jgi:hypothetical protein
MERTKHPIAISAIFTLIRFLPIFAAFAFVNTSTLPFESSRALLDITIRLVAVFVFWSMAEGVFMLWAGERNAGSENSRGYAAVALLLALLVLVVLQAFRAQSTQAQFLLLLGVLSLRGMSRGGWEQGRELVAIVVSPVAHSLGALLSFLLTVGSISWQAALISLAIGAFTAAIEEKWYADKIPQDPPKWVMPAYRATLFFPPFLIGSLSLFRQLPVSYISVFVVVFLVSRFIPNIASLADLQRSRFSTLAGIYILFIAILATARIYS